MYLIGVNAVEGMHGAAARPGRYNYDGWARPGMRLQGRPHVMWR